MDDSPGISPSAQNGSFNGTELSEFVLKAVF